ncbi:hypothetical protein HCB33_10840 [Listeria sp. FSL L7-0233]|uniref:hypothetical protein n=1 Tax=Listeria cossartiae TaxID=2838249 RepID=UPI00162342A4|nr:hypothetical protein [Listeria cossartiae]MBC2183852.1 hypothetical protein [Listeria cossartiae subsp. cossartiae]
MNTDIIKIYDEFDKNELNNFFDKLIQFVNKYESEFQKYTSLDYLKSIRKFKSQSFILGHSDDNLEAGIFFYKTKVEENQEEDICNQVSALIWTLSAYMIDEVCPVCSESNMRLTVIAGESEPIVKFCDECLYTGVGGKYVEIKEELIPASKNLVKSYLSMK